MEEYPRVHEEQDSLVVEFPPKVNETSRQRLRMVLDIGQSGGVIGVEIINLAFEAGENCLAVIGGSVSRCGDGVRYSYDEESDSFYIRLRQGRSQGQRALDGTVSLDERGAIIGLTAIWRV
jgi:uncharacterized protein YuzE